MNESKELIDTQSAAPVSQWSIDEGPYKPASHIYGVSHGDLPGIITH